MGPENLSVDEISQLIKLIGYGKFLLLILFFFVLINISFLIRNWINRSGSNKSLSLLQKQAAVLVDIKGVLERQYAENISIEQCETILTSMVNNNTHELTEFVAYIINNNNVEKYEEDIRVRLKEKLNLITNENSNMTSKFKYKRKRLNEFVDCQWTVPIYKAMVKHVFNETGDPVKRIKQANHSIRTHVENLKLTTLKQLSTY